MGTSAIPAEKRVSWALLGTLVISFLQAVVVFFFATIFGISVPNVITVISIWVVTELLFTALWLRVKAKST